MVPLHIQLNMDLLLVKSDKYNKDKNVSAWN